MPTPPSWAARATLPPHHRSGLRFDSLPLALRSPWLAAPDRLRSTRRLLDRRFRNSTALQALEQTLISWADVPLGVVPISWNLTTSSFPSTSHSEAPSRSPKSATCCELGLVCRSLATILRTRRRGGSSSTMGLNITFHGPTKTARCRIGTIPFHPIATSALHSPWQRVGLTLATLSRVS